MPFEPASQALSKYKVLDLTRVRSGPTCVRQLADWGADVVKIELPPALEGGNALGGARHGPDFQNLHRNKRSLTLNLKEKDGLEVFKRLVIHADVVVENYRPDVKKRLGIDYESLKSINSKIILGSISGFGQDGPYSKRPGFDQIAQGMGGLMSITGLPGQGPVRVGIPIADLCAGVLCAQGIMIALLEREKSGEGQWVQTSLLQAMIFMLDFQGARWTLAGEIPQQAGNNHPTSIPTGVFETTDGFINLAVAGNLIWQRFAMAVGHEDWIEHPDYKEAEARSKNRDALNAEIAKILKHKSSDEWVEILNEQGVPCGQIYTIDKTFEDEQVKHLEMQKTVNSGVLGDISLINQAIRMSRTPHDFVKAPPEAGEHSDEILTEAGYSAEDIANLRKQNVI